MPIWWRQSKIQSNIVKTIFPHGIGNGSTFYEIDVGFLVFYTPWKQGQTWQTQL